MTDSPKQKEKYNKKIKVQKPKKRHLKRGLASNEQILIFVSTLVIIFAVMGYIVFSALLSIPYTLVGKPIEITQDYFFDSVHEFSMPITIIVGQTQSNSNSVDAILNSTSEARTMENKNYIYDGYTVKGDVNGSLIMRIVTLPAIEFNVTGSSGGISYGNFSVSASSWNDNDSYTFTPSNSGSTMTIYLQGNGTCLVVPTYRYMIRSSEI